MIIVQISRTKDGKIHDFEIKGHAGYADHGEDIVCAGVSAVTVGTVNAIEALTGIVMNSRMKDGFLSGKLPLIEDEATSAKVQLLLESMLVMLTGIADSYGKYIQIDDINK